MIVAEPVPPKHVGLVTKAEPDVAHICRVYGPPLTNVPAVDALNPVEAGFVPQTTVTIVVFWPTPVIFWIDNEAPLVTNGREDVNLNLANLLYTLLLRETLLTEAVGEFVQTNLLVLVRTEPPTELKLAKSPCTGLTKTSRVFVEPACIRPEL